MDERIAPRLDGTILPDPAAEESIQADGVRSGSWRAALQPVAERFVNEDTTLPILRKRARSDEK